MKGIIIYKSMYGATKKYADWLNEETGYPVREQNKIKNDEIKAADMVIIGCPVLANKPQLAKWISKKWRLLIDKKIILYTTSGAPATDPKLQENFTLSFPEEMRKKIKYFPQGGKMVFSELSGIHKFMMNLGKKMIKDPEVREAMGKDVNNINREGLKSLLEYLQDGGE